MKAYLDTRSLKFPRFLCLLASALLLAGSLAHAEIPKPDRYPSPNRFDSRIKLFTTQDKAVPPAQGGIVFVGSSTITYWNKNLAKDFPEMGVTGRGFGGSNIADNAFYADKTVLPHKPRQIVFYAGENDIAEKRTPEGVLEDFQAFVAKVRSELPETPILYLSIKPSPRRWKMQEQFNEANALIKEFCDAQPNLQFLDIRPALLDASGNPRPELYVEDKLHLNADGYKILQQAVAPHLIAATAVVTETVATEADGGQPLADNAEKPKGKGKKEGKAKKGNTDTMDDPDNMDNGDAPQKGKKSDKAPKDDDDKDKKDNKNKKDDNKDKKDKKGKDKKDDDKDKKDKKDKDKKGKDKDKDKKDKDKKDKKKKDD